MIAAPCTLRLSSSNLPNQRHKPIRPSHLDLMFKDLPLNPHPPQIQKHLPGSIHARLPMSKHIINQSSSHVFNTHTSSISIWILHLHILNDYDYPSSPESSTVPCTNAPQHLAVQESKASSDQRITGAVEDLPPLTRDMGPPTAMQNGGAGWVFLLANYTRNPSSLPTPLFRGYWWAC